MRWSGGFQIALSLAGVLALGSARGQPRRPPAEASSRFAAPQQLRAAPAAAPAARGVAMSQAARAGLPRRIRSGAFTADVFPNIPVHPDPSTTQTQMSVATHPVNPDIVFAGSNAVSPPRGVGSQGWYYTLDGARHWTGRDTLPGHTDFYTTLYYNPAVAIDLDGRMYFNTLRQGTASVEVLVYRSENNGRTWIETALPDIWLADKSHIAVDNNPFSPFEGSVYTAFTNFDSAYEPNPIGFSRSTDHALKFSPWRAVSDTVGSLFAQGANIAVGPGGEVYVAWSGYDSWPPPLISHLGFNKSTDGGAHWGRAADIRQVRDVRGIITKGSHSIRTNSWPCMAVDRSDGPRRGWIYIVYAEKSPTVNVMVIRSTDGGATWSLPKKVAQDFGRNDHWSPWAAVDPATGILSVVYYDSRRFPANDTAEVYLSVSLDGGATFGDLLVSDHPFLPQPIPLLAEGYMGDYIGVAAVNGTVWPCWHDNRNGIYQAYVALVQIAEPEGPPRISLSTPLLDFGYVFQGRPVSKPLGIRNIGFPEPLQVTSIVSSAPEFAPAYSFVTLRGGADTTLSVTFSPQAIGPVSAVLTIESDDTSRPVAEVQMGADVVYPPSLSMSTEGIAFELHEGGDSTARVLMGNNGLGPLTMTARPGDRWFSADPPSATVPPGGRLVLEVRAPAVDLNAGEFSSALFVETNDPDRQLVHISVQARIIGSANIVVAGDSIGFGETFVGVDVSRVLRIKNTGIDSLWISGIGTTQPFLSVSEAAPFLVLPRSAADLHVHILPPAAGILEGDIVLSSNDPDDPLVRVRVTADAVDPPVALIGPQGFSCTLPEASIRADSLTVANTGAGTLRYRASVAYRSDPGAAIPARPSGPDGWDLPRILCLNVSAFVSPLLDSLRLPYTAVSMRWLDTVDWKSYDLFFVGGVQYQSDVQNLLRQKARIAGFAAGGGGIVALPELHLSAWQWIPEEVGVTAMAGNEVRVADPYHPIMAGIDSQRLSGWNPSFVSSFAYFPRTWEVLAESPGPEGRPLLLAGRHGRGRIVLAGLNFSGAPAARSADCLALLSDMIRWASPVGWLGVSGAGGSVAGGGSAAVGIAFNTSRLPPGDYVAAMRVDVNDPRVPSVTVPVSLVVSGTPRLGLPDPAIDFLSVFAGETKTASCTLSNPGSGTLEVTPALSGGGRFTLLDDSPFSLPPHEAGVVRVRFSPAGAETATSSLSLLTNDPALPRAEVRLSGRGVLPPVAFMSEIPLRVSSAPGDSAFARLVLANRGASDLSYTAGVSYSETADDRLALRTGPVRILVVEILDSTHRIPDALHLPYTTVSSRDFKAVDLNAFDILILGSFIAASTGEIQPLIDRAADLERFLKSGGGIIAMPQLSPLAWSWLPLPVEAAAFQGDRVRLTGPVHPVTSLLRAGDLDDWRYSYQQVFRSVPPGMEALALAEEEKGSAVLLAGHFGGGRLVLTGMHCERGVSLGNGAAFRLAASMIRWVAPRRWLSAAPSGGTLAPGDSAEINLTFRTKGLTPGAYRADFRVESNDPRRPSIAVPLGLTVGPMSGGVPEAYRLEQNYPNPFNPSTVITCEVPVESRVVITIYNLLGQEVESPVDRLLAAGRYSFTWSPGGLGSGIYIYRMTAVQPGGSRTFTPARKALFLK